MRASAFQAHPDRRISLLAIDPQDLEVISPPGSTGGLPTHEIARMTARARVSITVAQGLRLLHRTAGLNHGNRTTAVWQEGRDVLPQIVARCQDHPTSRVEDLLQYDREEAQQEHLPRVRGGGGDLALDILRTILNNTGEEWVLNVPRRGTLDSLPPDRVIEAPCRADTRGATPYAQEDGSLIYLLGEFAGATARVALSGTRLDAIKALAASQQPVPSYSKAQTVYDDLPACLLKNQPGRPLPIAPPAWYDAGRSNVDYHSVGRRPGHGHARGPEL